VQRIWKYEIPSGGAFALSMPEGAEVLCAQVHGGCPCIWARVDPDAQLVQRRFSLFGTGQPMADEPYRYVGTFQVMAGALVFHLFERLTDTS
jgi:hypothetical protein